MSGDEWITPTEALDMVRASLGPWSLLSGECHQRLIGWGRDELLRGKVARIVSYRHKKADAAPKPSTEEFGGDPLREAIAMGILSPSNRPLEREVAEDINLGIDDWQPHVLGHPGLSWWSSGELELTSISGSAERATLYGIRLSREDIERELALAGTPYTPPASPPAGSTPADRLQPRVSADRPQDLIATFSESPTDASLPGSVLPQEPRRRGRPEGSGSFKRDDAPLLAEMARMIAAGEARSPHAAAIAVASRAAGGGTEGSRAKRLRDAFKRLEGNGG